MGCCFNSSQNNTLSVPITENNILDTKDTEPDSEIIEMKIDPDDQSDILKTLFSAIKTDNIDKVNNLFTHSNHIQFHLFIYIWYKYYLDEKLIMENSKYKGRTPLIAAIKHNSWEVLQYFGSKKSDPNLSDQNGNTALHHSIMSQNDTFVKLIMDLKPDVNLRNLQELTPLDMANHTQKKIILRLV